ARSRGPPARAGPQIAACPAAPRPSGSAAGTRRDWPARCDAPGPRTRRWPPGPAQIRGSARRAGARPRLGRPARGPGWRAGPLPRPSGAGRWYSAGGPRCPTEKPRGKNRRRPLASPWGRASETIRPGAPGAGASAGRREMDRFSSRDENPVGSRVSAGRAAAVSDIYERTAPQQPGRRQRIKKQPATRPYTERHLRRKRDGKGRADAPGPLVTAIVTPAFSIRRLIEAYARARHVGGQALEGLKQALLLAFTHY
nr:hypothetical protein [Tanacetum cinerariifolium]